MKLALFSGLILLAAMGCAEPKAARFSEADIRTLAQNGAPVVDVRTPTEYDLGHVRGSTNIPIDELSQRIAPVAPDKKAPVIVHCQSGRRSAAAKQTLAELGYHQVIDLGSLDNARKILRDSPH